MARRLHLIPIVVMLLVAVIQAVTAGPDRLSPWKGGGFGMFATVDHARLVVVDGEVVDDAASANQADPSRAVRAAGGSEAVVVRPEFDADTDQVTWTVIARWP